MAAVRLARLAAALAFPTAAAGVRLRPPVQDDLALLQTRTGPSASELEAEADGAEATASFEDGLWVRQSASQRSAATQRLERSFSSRVQVRHQEVAILEPQVDLEGAASAQAERELSPVRRRLQDIDSTGVSSKRQILVNYGDVQYVTHFRIGRQTIVGILDTGSFELVVFSRACKSCGSAAKYDPKMSPNHLQGKLMTMQSYGSGDTYSAQAYDQLSIGPYAEMNQTFWEVVGARMPILATSAFEAIIGIGPPETPAVDAWQDAQDSLGNISVAYGDGTKPTAAQLKQAKDSVEAALEVSRNPTMIDTFGVGSFSLCLGSAPGSDGYLVWNDTSAFDSPQLFRRVPVIGKHTWSVKLGNIQLSMRNEDFGGGEGSPPGHTEPFACTGGGCMALLDSGTSLLAVPGSVISWLSREINRLDTDCSNIDELPDLVFTLGEQRFSLPPDAYVAEVKGTVPKYLQSFVRMTELKAETSSTRKKECQLLLMESYAEGQHGPFWILGMPFFRKYYTTFFIGDDTDSRALYIAPASEDCTPAAVAKASLARSKPYRRLIDPNKVHVPNVVQKAYSQRHIAL